MMRRRRFTALFAALLLAISTGTAALAQGSSWTIDQNHAEVNFEIRHMGVSTVRGAFSGITGTVVWDEKNLANSSVTATIDATTVSTNNEARDKHLKSPDFFNVEKFPTLTFKSTSVQRVNGKLQLVGDLTQTGITKSVTLDVDGPTPPQKGMQGGRVIGFSATGIIHRSDFNVGSKFAPPMLGDDVKFTIDVEADQK
ncbi:MAG TPA: YceI family protein [Granulicella sp.]|jgi:polyisoprenoid-binding protein YceI|nr:YceI family protein [Granulicella sp.]